MSEKNYIQRAAWVSKKEIQVTLSPFCKDLQTTTQQFKVRKENGQELLLQKAEPLLQSQCIDILSGEETFMEFLITTVEPLDILQTYKVIKKGYGEIETTIGNIFEQDFFIQTYTYDGEDLGCHYTPEKTTLKLWAPLAKSVSVLLYQSGDPEIDPDCIQEHPMTQGEKGTWIGTLEGDFENQYYVYQAQVGSQTIVAVDPYAKGVGVNGQRGMILDLAKTNPEGFLQQTVPPLARSTDAIIYEMHVRDYSIHPSSGMKNKGKFLAFTEDDTTNDYGGTTGIAHLKQLGITHVQLLPIFDYESVNEKQQEPEGYNWGYDPKNYNVPEGSYATDPNNGVVRIVELKKAIQSLHSHGIRVVMDVVYNHTFSTDNSLNLLTPGYFYRTDDDGSFSNASGCGNEIASERPMVRKFIMDSVLYWAKSYKIDGFRFDLMGVHDIETMNQIRRALDAIDPTILVYGEPWTGGHSVYPSRKRVLKQNMFQVDAHIACFSDDIRDAIKGKVNTPQGGGFVNGGTRKNEELKFGIVAGVPHQQVEMSKVFTSEYFWAKGPTQTITYNSCHDNYTLWDKLIFTRKDLPKSEVIKENKLAALITLTSQGLVFLHGGEEFARTKKGVENSYQSPDAINQIDWNRKEKYEELFQYYQGLIALRKNVPAFHLETSDQVQKKIAFLSTEDGVVAYTLETEEGPYTAFAMLFNGTGEEKVFFLRGDGDVFVNDAIAQSTPIEGVRNIIVLPPRSGKVVGLIGNAKIRSTMEVEQHHQKIMKIVGMSAVLGVAGVVLAKSIRNKRK